ncbi:Chorismate mutase I / Prephenate dehydratase [hydrothermal vent metagenome]|uniref:Bifunctional chorismate mutase/prephenate dehydratase n=1 Tax=hydrothermal vent metagenome TaxID=652676 RepID=A0A3B0ZT52_9ZZZZ
MSDNTSLDSVRERIDQLDVQIQDLIVQRAACAIQIADLKGREANTVYYRPEREAQVLRRVMARNCGDLETKAMARIFREMMAACLAIEQPLSVAFLGPEGTYTQEAARKHFGQASNMIPVTNIENVFHEVESERVHYGVVAVENSTEGSVTLTLDMFLDSPLKICGEVALRIRHCLLSHHEALSDIKMVYGHQQALSQCRNWLNTHLHDVEQIAVRSNAEAARIAAETVGAAAIAGERAAEVYQHNILERSIEDNSNNTTRFLILSSAFPPASGVDKTSLLVTTGNQPGTLHKVLSPFVKHKVSMTRIESRPSRRGTWDYVFFIDIEGHIEDANVAAAVQALEKTSVMVKLLGSYPNSVL